MKLIVGIGNPGREYEGTRHNLGFRVVDLLAARHGIDCRKRQFRARTGGGQIGAQPVLLLKPQTYVNESGAAVRAAAAWYGCPLEDILVVCDDLALPLGAMRARRRGSSGGHNGLRSIAAALGSEDFIRLRLGIGWPEVMSGRDYVLSRFAAAEQPLVEEIVAAAAETTEIWVEQGIDACMEKANRRGSAAGTEDDSDASKEEPH